MIKAPYLDRRVRLVCLGVAAWAFVALVSALQGKLFAAYHGREQDWWPTLGYTAAIFSVWALLTPAIIKAADRIYAAGLRRLIAASLVALGYPLAMMLHVLLFVALFWPLYGSQAPTPFAMMEPVLLANFDKSAFAYLTLIAVAGVRRNVRQSVKPQSFDDGARTDDGGLWIRVGGGSHFVRFEEIDWIAAAGDYAEVHAGPRILLADRSLAALAQQVPADEFVRIHRGAIIRLDRVREVISLGRGDAKIVLRTGHSLRLSRRYRHQLAAYLPL